MARKQHAHRRPLASSDGMHRATRPAQSSQRAEVPLKTDSDVVTCIGLLMHLDAAVRLAVLKELVRISRGPIVVQYGVVGALLRLKSLITGKPAGAVRSPVVEAELRDDLRRSGLRERSRFWA